MKDRQPGAPGQYKAVITATELQKLQTGEEFVITMTRDDQPLVEGTPYNKASVLPDDLAARICPNVLDPTPADAYSGLLAIAKNAATVNLLDNSDFRNPVNTNGQTSYELGAWGGSCVDRWLANGIGASVTIASDGLHLSNSIYQSVARQELLSDKTVTFAVKINSTVYCTSGVVRYTNAWGRACTLEVEGIWLEVCMQNDNSLWACIEGTGGTVITVEWAALYEGEYTLETLPEYQPKGYNVELLNCGGYARNAEYTAIIPVSAWADYGSAKQCSVSVGGILATDSPIIDVQLTGTADSVDSDLLLDEEWGKIYRASAYDGGITIIAREAPTGDLPIKIKVVR